MRYPLQIKRKADNCPEFKNNLIEHKQYIDKFLEELPEIRNWKWGQGETQKK
jgi:xylulose-5-phosphate/fructose-6-phosphate phosphoketolase